MLTWLICVVITVSVVGIVVQKSLYPQLDLSKPGDAIFQMVSTIIGALVGFISGRAYGRREEKELPTEQKAQTSKQKGQ
jgi:hypothetical protein